MLAEDEITEIFVMADEFCIVFNAKLYGLSLCCITGDNRVFSTWLCQ